MEPCFVSHSVYRCGWPGCGKKLPRWRLALPMVFDLPEGEQLGRFCERACMAVSDGGDRPWGAGK